MARARKKTEVQSDTATLEPDTLPPGATDFNPAEFDPQPAAGQQSATAVQEQPAATERAPETNGHAEQQAPATNGHAAAVEKKTYPPAPDPFGIAKDVIAGVRLFESRQFREMALKFDEKPSEAVIAKLKESGYRWKPQDKVWAHPVRSESAMTTRIDAEKLYQEVSKMIREERNIGHDIGVS